MCSPKCNSCLHDQLGRRLWEFGHFQIFSRFNWDTVCLRFCSWLIRVLVKILRCGDVRELGIFGESIWFILSCNQTWPENHPLYHTNDTFRWFSMFSLIFPLQAAFLRNFQLPRVITGGYLYLENVACLLLSLHYLFSGCHIVLFISCVCFPARLQIMFALDTKPPRITSGNLT